MKVICRRAEQGDLELLAAQFDVYRVYAGQQSDIALAMSFLSERMAAEQSVIFIALADNGNLLGFTQLYPSYSSILATTQWILNDLYVDQSARGMGIGRQLMQKAILFVRSTGARGIALETSHRNLTAQVLYESLGFQRNENYSHYFLTV